MGFSKIHAEKIIVLDRGEYTSCTVHIHGAAVTSWRIKNKEMVFVSRESHFTGLSNIRGGIQFVFPVIGKWAFGSKHGFARDLPWTLEEEPKKTESGDVYAVISLKDNAYTASLWGFKFKLYYKITLYEYKIGFALGIENYSTSSFLDFKIMQHSFMKVPDITKCEIIGLHNCKYADYLQDNRIFHEDREKVTIAEPTERIYYNTNKEILVTNFINGGTLKIIKYRTKDITLWNPWFNSTENDDLENAEYKEFISVQTGVSEKPLRLEPLSCWEAFYVYEYIEPKKEILVNNMYDLFEGYC